MTTRQARLIAAVVIAGGGLVCLVWAFVREYRDLQRLYALVVGWLLLTGAVIVMLTALRRRGR